MPWGLNEDYVVARRLQLYSVIRPLYTPCPQKNMWLHFLQ